MTVSVRKVFWNQRVLVVAFLVHLLAGCIGLDAYPVAARAGDTVTVALGSPDGMTRANTTVVFEDSQGAVHDLTGNLRGIFKLYPDRASAAWDSIPTSALVNSSQHEPWLTVMALDLPPILPAGAGKLRVSSSADYPSINAHINNVPIRLEILPGSGAPNPLEYVFGNTPESTSYGDLRMLEPRTSVTVRPSGNGSTVYGAIEIKLHIETNKGTALTPTQVRVLMEDLTAVTESQRSWFWDLDNGQDYTITLISPSGWLAESEARCRVVFKQADIVGTPAITSIRYFDVNGMETTGPDAGNYSLVVDSR